jgi:sulfide dehydrogenase cytochrome subunit
MRPAGLRHRGRRMIGGALAGLALAVAGPALAGDLAPPGATSCSGCHGATADVTVGPPLHGRPAAELTAAMADFREGRRKATVMDRIAKGFTPEETQAIAAWIAEQP